MQRYFAKEKKNNLFVLDDKDLHHIKNVMRMKDNDTIEVIFDGKLYESKINYEEEIKITSVHEVETISDDNKPKITLVIPLLKEAKMDLILQKSTELGIDTIIPIVTERTLVKIDHKEDKRIERWLRICKEASEQSKRLNIPNIDKVKKINDLKNISGLKLVCSTSTNCDNLKNFLQTNRNYDRITIVIGPEGGLSLNEEQQLNNLGFTSISLGKNIFRVETVPLVILSMINYEYME